MTAPDVYFNIDADTAVIVPADMPKTGDHSSISMWLALLTMAGMALRFLRRRVRS